MDLKIKTTSNVNKCLHVQILDNLPTAFVYWFQAVLSQQLIVRVSVF